MTPVQKTALITGSTSGIGLGIARGFARAGYDVVLNGFGDAPQIDALKAEIEALGVKAAYSAADMSRPAEIRAMVAEAEQTFRRPLAVLVNNAGIQHVAPVDEFPEDRWDAVIAINLSAAFHAIKAALPGMRRAGNGRIVNIASAHGLVASAAKAAYVAAKHGLIGLTKVVALDAANTGVTCNAICPGWVLTPLVQKQIDARAAASGIAPRAAAEDLIREKQPLLEFTTPDQIAALALYLASDAAATVTGTHVSIDGGWTAQ